jgi:hypothetical protein
MLNPLFALSFQAARFGWEMQSMIALRLMRLAGGGASAQSEAHRIGTEKMAALAEAQTSAIKGSNGPEVAKKALNGYKKRVRRNKRRLSR